MTKERYYNLCEAMGTEPADDEVPVEFEDLLIEVQDALRIYASLQDSWDYMGGNYIGKNLSGFKDIMDIFEVAVEDRRSVYELVMQIDKIRGKRINDAVKAKEKKPPK
jgi:hypothetical protein